MESITIFGGSFNPIHIGHLITARFLIEKYEINNILFMPAYKSPFKLESNYIEDVHRIKMINLSIKDEKYFSFADYEINQKKTSYTIDTINYFTDFSVNLIIGYDNYINFEKWYKYEEILEKVGKIYVLNRKTDTVKKNNNNKFIFTYSPLIEISSTEIRRRIKNDLSISYLVTDSVKEYIYEKSLYK